MKQLTQKQYLEDLQAGSKFIQCVHGMTLEQVQKAVEDFQGDLEPCYRYVSVIKRSKDFVFTSEDGTKSYRDFYGKNKYFTHKQILYHVNTVVDDPKTCSHPRTHVSIFINS